MLIIFHYTHLLHIFSGTDSGTDVKEIKRVDFLVYFFSSNDLVFFCY